MRLATDLVACVPSKPSAPWKQGRVVCPPQRAGAGSGLSCSSCSLNAAGRVGESIFHPDPAAPLPTLCPVFYAPFSSPASLPPAPLLPSQPRLHRGERTSLLPGRAPAAPGAAVGPSQWPPSLGLAFLLGLLPALFLSPECTHSSLLPSVQLPPPPSCPPPLQPVGGQQSVCVCPGKEAPLKKQGSLASPDPIAHLPHHESQASVG